MFLSPQDNTPNANSAEKNRAVSDRRYLPRWEVHNKILFRREEETACRQCLSKDINSIGTCIVTEEPVELNKPLVMTIYLADDIEPIEAVGRPIWNSVKENQNLAGVRFERISSKARDLIFQFAFVHKKEDLMWQWYKNSASDKPLP